MKPYRDLFPHAGLMLSNTKTVAERVIVLPTGPNLPDGAIGFIADLLRIVASAPVCA
jgi:dTDP-4-amino-4,6-dideoxygalactose transaminase